jgi:tetratricopeptide (TPR) repeat protein
LTLVGVLSIGVVLTGCPGNDSKPDVVVIRTGPDLVARHNELKALTEEALIKNAEGKPLEQKDLDNLNKAEPIARGIVAFDGGSYTAPLVLGQIQLALGKRDEALRNMLQCVLNAPPEYKRSEDDKFIVAETLNDIGNIYYSKNQLDEAEGSMRQALEISPKNIKYLSNFAQILIAGKRFEEAKVILERIRKEKPDSEALAALELLLKKPADDGNKKK